MPKLTLLAAAAFASTAALSTAALSTAALADSSVAPIPAFDGERLTTASISSADPFDARGVIVPNAEVTLGAGVAAPIKAIPFKPGAAFGKGDTLVGFDCSRQRADLRAAKASLSKATMHLTGKQRLLKRGAAGRQEVREASADVAASKAQVDGIMAVLSQCTVRAPFAGRVLERHADPYETPGATAPILTVVDDSVLELDLIVPSKWLAWVKPGTSFSFAVDEVGREFKAHVIRVGAKVDAVSQTVKLTGAFEARPARVLAGMSGTARFAPPR